MYATTTECNNISKANTISMCLNAVGFDGFGEFSELYQAFVVYYATNT